jgi:predicted secreted protein
MVNSVLLHEDFMHALTTLSVALVFFGAPLIAQAQGLSAIDSPASPSVSSQVVHLSSSASAQVQQDWMVMTLAVQKEGLDAVAVQNHIKTHLAAALNLSQAAAQTGFLNVSTGQMSISPRYGREGKTNGWTGVGELVLQGRDIERITNVAGRVQGMTVSQVQWQVSPELKQKTENQIQGQAVAQFKERASALAESFGFRAYGLREVRVSTQENSSEIQPRMAMVQMDAPPNGPQGMPAQAGQSRVVVSVSGSIQLR